MTSLSEYDLYSVDPERLASYDQKREHPLETQQLVLLKKQALEFCLRFGVKVDSRQESELVQHEALGQDCGYLEIMGQVVEESGVKVERRVIVQAL